MAEKRKRVLVVDDEPAFCELVQALLRQFGFAVETAQNGIQALAKLDRLNFDLVLTDLWMPGMMGDQLAEEIKRRQPDLPVLLLTGQRPESVAPHIERVLAKPFSMAELREAVLALTNPTASREPPSA